MKRQRRSPEWEKGINESSLAPLPMGAVANWSWDGLMDGFAMNVFWVKIYTSIRIMI